MGGNNGSHAGSTDDQSQENVLGDGKSKCNCPAGYSTTPKNPGDQPYFLNPDDAAINWAYEMGKVSMKRRDSKEYSSTIYSVDGLYATSKVSSFTDKSINFRESPGINHKSHEVPSGSSIIGHIHLHWYGSKYLSAGTNSNNDYFSSTDLDIHTRVDALNNNKEMYFYVIGASGILWGKYPKTMPPITGQGYYYEDPRAENISEVQSGFYDSNISKPEPCKCYKQ